MSTEAPGVLVARGAVQHGDQRGRTIGFPTVNLLLEGDDLRDGVWGGWLALGDERHPVAVSVGGRPTFYGADGQRLLEAHILDFDREIYGEVVTVWLCEPIRAQRRFDSVDQLTVQLAADVERCRVWARSNPEIWQSWTADAVPEGIALPLSMTT